LPADSTRKTNALKIKGAGEPGISGAGAAWPTPSTTPSACV